MAGSYLAMVLFGCFSAGWLFFFPQAKAEIAVIFFLEEVWFFIPFLFLFGIQKKWGFNRALWLFPIIWMLWEWLYLSLEFTMGTHLSAYSQSSNLWLIQFIDLTGMWGLSFWLMLFNVLLFKQYQAQQYHWKPALFSMKTAFIVAMMLGIPLLYSAVAFSHFGTPTRQKSLRVSLVPTQFSASFLNDRQNDYWVVEQTLHRSDSLAYYQGQRGLHSDLYVWPEAGLNFELGFYNLDTLLTEAVTDWQSALLTGGKGIVTGLDSTDQRFYVSGILLSHRAMQAGFHHKTVLTPGQEAIPYHRFLAKLPFFPIAETDARYFRAGLVSEPLPLTTQNGTTFRVGVSLCFEQWYPQHWVGLAQNQADFMVHLAGEGWYGDVGFQQFMANVTRMRCIETRRQSARCANVGLSLFIDQLGRFYEQPLSGTLRTATANLYAAEGVTWYARFPDWFPLTGLIVFCLMLFFFMKKGGA